MKKILTTILICLLLPTMTMAEVYWEEPYANYNIIGTTIIIDNVKVRYVDEIPGHPNACGVVSDGGNAAYPIQMSVSNECLENIDVYFVHELLHIFDTQNDITKRYLMFNDLPAFKGEDSIREKFAYWGSFYLVQPTWLVINYPNEFKKLDKFFENYKINDLNNYQY